MHKGHHTAMPLSALFETTSAVDSLGLTCNEPVRQEVPLVSGTSTSYVRRRSPKITDASIIDKSRDASRHGVSHRIRAFIPLKIATVRVKGFFRKLYFEVGGDSHGNMQRRQQPQREDSKRPKVLTGHGGAEPEVFSQHAFIDNRHCLDIQTHQSSKWFHSRSQPLAQSVDRLDGRSRPEKSAVLALFLAEPNSGICIDSVSAVRVVSAVDNQSDVIESSEGMERASGFRSGLDPASGHSLASVIWPESSL